MKLIKNQILVIVLVLLANSLFAQESYNRTFNLGVGIGNYSYAGNALPVLHIDYELTAAKNFTLAPFASFFSYSNYNTVNGHKYYYHETAIPIGVKGTFYFDELLQAHPKWDFYLGASLGFAIINSSYDVGYVGDRDAFNHSNHMFTNLHIGSEYHFTRRIGGFLDLSNGLSTVGLSIH